MTDPLFWLVLSLLFVTISLTIVLAVAIPALKELARAARSAEKLFDTLRREFPPTLQAIRLTGLEISDLTDDVSEGVQSAGQVVKQVDQSLSNVRKQAQRVQSGTRNVLVGLKTAWRTFSRTQKSAPQRRSIDRLPPRSEAESGFNPSLGEARSLQRRLTPEEIAALPETPPSKRLATSDEALNGFLDEPPSHTLGNITPGYSSSRPESSPDDSHSTSSPAPDREDESSSSHPTELPQER